MIPQSYKSSEKARKQRKFRYKAPLHLRRMFLSANLSKELRKKYLRRSFPLRKGDNVKVMKGGFKGKTGKIFILNLQKSKIYIENIQRSKRDGTKVNVPLDPSNVQITELNLDDKKRTEILNRKLKK